MEICCCCGGAYVVRGVRIPQKPIAGLCALLMMSLLMLELRRAFVLLCGSDELLGVPLP